MHDYKDELSYYKVSERVVGKRKNCGCDEVFVFHEQRDEARQARPSTYIPSEPGEIFASLDQCINYRIAAESHAITRLYNRSSPKRQKTAPDEIPYCFAQINTRLGKAKAAALTTLLDTGASRGLISEKHVKKLRVRTTPSRTTFTTAGGVVETHREVRIQFKLPEFHANRVIEWVFQVTSDLGNYDMIIGRDLLRELGFKFDFKTREVEWDSAAIAMKIFGETPDEDAWQADADGGAKSIKQILDAKYAPADIPQKISEMNHLSEEDKSALKTLLQKHETLFDGTLGTWKGEPYDIELKPNVTPYHARPYPVPKAYEQTLRDEVDRLCAVGVLKKVNRSEWAAPSFIIPKKDKTVRFINDFRELNKRIKRKPFPLPKIQELLLKLEGFQYATSLDLNMGYYHVELSPNAKKLCTLVFPWGKYEMQRLPMGLSNSPDIFQEKMSSLFADLEYIRTYIDDLLVLTKGSYLDHLEKLDVVLQRLKDTGLKVNIKKSFFAKAELEYLGYWITRDGIQPVANKVQAIQSMLAPRNKKELRAFIGIVNYYRDMWVRRSHILAPLASLTSKTAKWEWTGAHQNAFDTMKKIISKEVLLTYPNFHLPFDIHTDASDTQLGAVISQNGKPIAFYSRKLNPAQTRYTTTERELLAIVETLKEFRTILLGQQIRVYTDHKNLTYKNFNTERVMRWRLILEEYGPELVYVRGETNVVADALSRLGKDEKPFTEANFAEYFGGDELPESVFPLTYKYIMRHQRKDTALLQKAASDSRYSVKVFRGGGKKRPLVVRDSKIVIPQSLQRRCVEWYHETLCHPGETRTEHTIRQHFYWKGLRTDVVDICKKCRLCQLTKRKTLKYGHLPIKEPESEPWEILCVDLIGPYTINQGKRHKGKQKQLELWCLTMIDPATGWFEMVRVPNKEAFSIAELAEKTWFTRYPWPQQVIYDRGTEFMGEFRRMVKEDYGVLARPITARNPQANAILERVHQTIGNMIRTFELQHSDDTVGLDGILAAVMFAVRATYHTTLQATPMQLVFGRDAILNTRFEANWKLIRERKMQRIAKNNAAENKTRLPYEYRVGQQIMIKQDQQRKFGANPYDGPYPVVAVNDNGTVRIQKGAVTQTWNIRNIYPYHS